MNSEFWSSGYAAIFVTLRGVLVFWHWMAMVLLEIRFWHCMTLRGVLVIKILCLTSLATDQMAQSKFISNTKPRALPCRGIISNTKPRASVAFGLDYLEEKIVGQNKLIIHTNSWVK